MPVCVAHLQASLLALRRQRQNRRSGPWHLVVQAEVGAQRCQIAREYAGAQACLQGFKAGDTWDRCAGDPRAASGRAADFRCRGDRDQHRLAPEEAPGAGPHHSLSIASWGRDFLGNFFLALRRLPMLAHKAPTRYSGVRSRLRNAQAHRAEAEYLVLRPARARLKNTEPCARLRPMATCRTMRPSLKAELTAVQAAASASPACLGSCLGWGWSNAHRRTELGARKAPH